MNIGFRFMDGATDWGWIRKHVEVLRVEDTSGIVAVDSNTGELLAACVLDNWTPNSVQCHLVIANPLVFKHGYAERVYGYVFNEKDISKMIGTVPSNNTKAIKLNKHFGFTELVCIADVFREGVGCVLMELKRENCKYLGKE